MTNYTLQLRRLILQQCLWNQAIWTPHDILPTLTSSPSAQQLSQQRRTLGIRMQWSTNAHRLEPLAAGENENLLTPRRHSCPCCDDFNQKVGYFPQHWIIIPGVTISLVAHLALRIIFFSGRKFEKNPECLTLTAVKMSQHTMILMYILNLRSRRLYTSVRSLWSDTIFQ